MRSLVTAAALVVALTPHDSTPAGVPLVDAQGVEFKWDLASEQPNVIGGKVTFFPHVASLRDGVAGQKTPLSAVRDAVREWEIGTTAMRFHEDPSRAASGPNGTDRVNYVGWIQSGLDATTLAVTTVTRDGSRITDMDVTLNDRDWIWDTFTPGRSGIADVQSLVTHEWGHALGCDHVPLRTSTMQAFTLPGVISFRSLSPDDRALVGTVYPNALFAAATGSITGVVDRVGSTNDRAIHVVAVGVASGEPEGSTLTRPDGGWRIDGLAGGVYRIVAAPCLPLKGSMNDFWLSASTTFLPSVLRQDAANPSTIQPVAVLAGQMTSVAAMSVADTSAPFEPNDSIAQARPVEIGQALCARFESGGDEDWYSFTGAAGQKITVNVLSWHLGATADPAIEVVSAASGVEVAQDDARPPQLWANQPEGQDLDVRIVGFALPRSGEFLLHLRNQSSAPSGNGFYVLLVTPSTDAPSPALTTVSAAPRRLDADGVSRSAILVQPRKETGDDVGPGATVTLPHTGAGLLAPVLDRGDGTYVANVTSPSVPGVDRFTVVVTTAQGSATLLDAVTLVYLGPVDVATSTFLAVPRRIEADGAAQATITLVPRDTLGEELGPGRAVSMTLTAPAGASLAGVVDLGNGGYGDILTAPSQRGAGTVSAAVDGVAPGLEVAVAFGFDLAEVLADVRTDVQAYASTPGIAPRASKLLGKADALAARTLSDLETGGAGAEARAVAAAQRILSTVAAARAKARAALPNRGTERDLSRAVRQAASDAVAAAVVVRPRDQRRLDAAHRDIAAGDAAFALVQLQKATSLWRRALERVRNLQP